MLLHFILISILLLILFYYCNTNIFVKKIANNDEILKDIAEKSRENIGYILEKGGYKVGMEIGVQSGKFTDKLLNIWKHCKRYTMIDPWIQQKYYDDGANVNQYNQNLRFFDAMKIVSKYSNRTFFSIFRTKSEEAYKLFFYNSYDFIYIDGRHDYYSVKNDIRNYYPILKEGGILCGDDYSYAPGRWKLYPDGTVDKLNKSVKGAVDEFIKTNKLKIYISKDKSWCIMK